MSQVPKEQEISTALEKLMITNVLEKNGENTDTSLFKPKILCDIDRIKEKKKHHDIDFIYDYLSRTKTSNIDKVSLEQIFNELKENILVNNKTSLRDSPRQINTPQNLVNYLHSNSSSSNELTKTESVSSEESTVDDNSPSNHADIHTPLTTKDNLPACQNIVIILL